MSDIMQVLFNHVHSQFLKYLDRDVYQAAVKLEDRNLNALKAGLNEKQLAIMERYQDAVVEREFMELEAMFQAAFALTKELS